MAKSELGPYAEVEVRTINTTKPDEVAKISVGGEKVELFEANNNPELKALKTQDGIIVEARWPNEFAYGINKNGVFANNPHFLKQGEKMNLRAHGIKGISAGIPDSTQITHLKPEKD